MLRGLMGLLLFFAVILGIALPALYFITAAQLPPLESEFDLERYLKAVREGHPGARTQGAPERPQLSAYPKDFVSLYLSALSCPTYRETPPEVGLDWGRRVFKSVLLQQPSPGDGQCEFAFAYRIIQAFGISGQIKQSVAVLKLHRLLKKDDLLAYDLATTSFEPGILGPEQAAWRLFKKPLKQLNLAEMGELSLTLPATYDLYDLILECSNAAQIRLRRDNALGRLANDGLAAPDRVKHAMERGAACLH